MLIDYGFYGMDAIALGELVRRAANDEATIIMPILQRSFVWDPERVVAFVDSLLKSYPFGSLLLWSTPVKQNEEFPIPAKTFACTIDRTARENEDLVRSATHSREFLMVLDGQQRVQSLLLAFAGDGRFGFRMIDDDWRKQLGDNAESVKRITKGASSIGKLHVDVEKLALASQETQRIEDMDFTKGILRWVTPIKDVPKGDTEVPANQKPLPRLSDGDNKYRFIPLCSLWRIADTDDEDDAQRLIEEYCRDNDMHDYVAAKGALRSLKKLLLRLHKVKMYNLHYYIVKGRDSSKTGTQYFDSVIEVFTRLNTQGRELGREDIIFAYLKTGWPDSSERIHELRDELEEQFGVDLEVLGLVENLSFVWSGVYSDTGTMLRSAELLGGKKPREFADGLRENWGVIEDSLKATLDLVRNRCQLEYREDYESVYSITAVWALVVVLNRWFLSNKKRFSDVKFEHFELAVSDSLKSFAPRWFYGSQWAEKWSRDSAKSLQVYLTRINRFSKLISDKSKPEEVEQALDELLQEWLRDVTPIAVLAIDRLGVTSRHAVSAYRTFLYAWSGLSKQRFDSSKDMLSLRKNTHHGKPSVDHVYAHARWIELVKSEGIDSTSEVAFLVNSLGNCRLLKSTYNSSKGKEEFGSWLKKTARFKTKSSADIIQWANSLDIPTELLEPKGKVTVASLEKVISDADQRMKSELKEFIKGNSRRQIVDDSNWYVTFDVE